MLGLAETSLFYLLAGFGVGMAVLLQDDTLSAGERFYRVLTAIIFWPIYIPAVLQAPHIDGNDVPPKVLELKNPERQPDAMDDAIDQVETELDAALNSLGGWAESVLAREDVRFSELRRTWRSQADRIRELDTLLLRPEFVAVVTSVEDEAAGPLAEPIESADERIRQTEESRRGNIARLRSIRRQLHDDLMGTLAWVRELVTMIHLAKFTGAPASRAEELVTQIAAAVEGLSEVAEWQDETVLQTV